MTDYFGNNYFGNNFFGFYYFGPDSASAETENPDSKGKHLVLGMGPMGKPSVHPHPLFSRLKH